MGDGRVGELKLSPAGAVLSPLRRKQPGHGTERTSAASAVLAPAMTVSGTPVKSG
jgi:hypothetical protein